MSTVHHQQYLNTVHTAIGVCHAGILKVGKIASVYTCTLWLHFTYNMFYNLTTMYMYRSADKSLARPGRKRANVSVRMA